MLPAIDRAGVRVGSRQPAMLLFGIIEKLRIIQIIIEEEFNESVDT